MPDVDDLIRQELTRLRGRGTSLGIEGVAPDAAPQAAGVKSPAIALAPPDDVDGMIRTELARVRKPVAPKAEDVEPPKTEPIGFREAFGKGVEEEKYLPYIGSGEEAYKIGRLVVAANRFQGGTATEEDVDLLSQYKAATEDEERRGYSIGGIVGNILVNLPAFAGELASTGGIYSAGKTAAIKGGREVLEGVIKGRLKNIVLRGAGTAVGAAAQLPLAGATRIAANTAERLLENYDISKDEAGKIQVALSGKDDGFAAALGKGTLDSYIEILSERAGGALKHIGVDDAVSGLKRAVFGRWMAKHPGKAGEFLTRVSKATGWNGVLGEIFEEEVGKAARAATGLEDYRTTTLKELAAEAIAFSVPGAIGTGIRKLSGPSAPAAKPTTPGVAPVAPAVAPEAAGTPLEGPQAVQTPVTTPVAPGGQEGAIPGQAEAVQTPAAVPEVSADLFTQRLARVVKLPERKIRQGLAAIFPLLNRAATEHGVSLEQFLGRVTIRGEGAASEGALAQPVEPISEGQPINWQARFVGLEPRRKDEPPESWATRIREHLLKTEPGFTPPPAGEALDLSRLPWASVVIPTEAKTAEQVAKVYEKHDADMKREAPGGKVETLAQEVVAFPAILEQSQRVRDLPPDDPLIQTITRRAEVENRIEAILAKQDEQDVDKIGKLIRYRDSLSDQMEWMRKSRNLDQGRKGGIEIHQDGQAILYLFEKADITTIEHELMHFARRYLPVEDQAVLERAANRSGHKHTHRDPVTGKTMTERAKVTNGVWNRAAEEYIARAWERYLHEGIAPTPKMQVVFDKIKKMFREVYKNITGSAIDVRLSYDLRQYFNRILSEDPETVKNAKHYRAKANAAQKGVKPPPVAEAVLAGTVEAAGAPEAPVAPQAAPEAGIPQVPPTPRQGPISWDETFKRARAGIANGTYSVDKAMQIQPGAAIDSEWQAAIGIFMQDVNTRWNQLRLLIPRTKDLAAKDALKAERQSLEKKAIHLYTLESAGTSEAGRTLNEHKLVGEMARQGMMSMVSQNILGDNPRFLAQDIDDTATQQMVANYRLAGQPDFDAEAMFVGMDLMNQPGHRRKRLWMQKMADSFPMMGEAKLEELYRDASREYRANYLLAHEAAKQKIHPINLVQQLGDEPTAEDIIRAYKPGFIDNMMSAAVVFPLFNPGLWVRNGLTNGLMQAAYGTGIEALAYVGKARKALLGGEAPKFDPGAGLVFVKGTAKGYQERLDAVLQTLIAEKSGIDAMRRVFEEIDESSRAVKDRVFQGQQHEERPLSITGAEGAVGLGLKRAFNLTGLVLSGSDKIMSGAAFDSLVMMEAMKRLKAKGLNGVDLANAIPGEAAAMVAANDPYIQTAQDTAQEMVFLSELGSIGKRLGDFMYIKGKSAIGDLTGPFWIRNAAKFFVKYHTVPINVAKMAFRFSPARVAGEAVLGSAVAVDKAIENVLGKNALRNPEQRKQLRARYVGQQMDQLVLDLFVASLGAWLTWWLWKQGFLTGKLEKPGSRARSMQDAAGMVDHGVKVGDSWVSYNGFTPMAQAVAASADALDQGKRALMGEKDLDEAFGRMVAAHLVAVTDTGYSRALRDLTQAFDEDNPQLANTVARAISGSYVPAIVRQTAQMIDPVKRYPTTLQERFLTQIPGLSDVAPPYVSSAGSAYPIPMLKAMGIANVGTPKGGIEEDLAQQGIAIPYVGKTILKKKVDPANRSQIMRERGEMLTPAIRQMMMSEWWKDASAAQKQKAVDTLAERFTQVSPSYRAFKVQAMTEQAQAMRQGVVVPQVQE